MKTLILLLGISLPPSFLSPATDCTEAYTQAENAYNHTKKASMSNNFEDLHFCLGKAITAYENAIRLANQCNCEDAAKAAEDALELVQKANSAKTVDDGQKYSNKALEDADMAMEAANDCSY